MGPPGPSPCYGTALQASGPESRNFLGKKEKKHLAMDSHLRFIEILKSKRNMLAGEQGSLNVWIMLMVDAQVLSLHSKVMKLGRLKLAHLATKIHIV